MGISVRWSDVCALVLFGSIVKKNVIYHGRVDRIQQTVSEIKRCLQLDSYLLCTLISTNHRKYGFGEEIEENTFVIAEDNEKSHPHHYFDREEIKQYLCGFNLFICEEKEHFHPRSYHWLVLARIVS